MQLELLPAASVQEYAVVLALGPGGMNGKQAAPALETVGFGSHVSVQLAEFGVVHPWRLLHSTVCGAGHTTTGLVVSPTVTDELQQPSLPQLSLAQNVVVVVPTG